VRLPTASWGNMLSSRWGTLLSFEITSIPGMEKSNWTLVWPTVAIFVSVISLSLLGEGLRRALDPGSEA
jgi:ABC-type dipeptide/oligopeptide/nickel transport system permease subunit